MHLHRSFTRPPCRDVVLLDMVGQGSRQPIDLAGFGDYRVEESEQVNWDSRYVWKAFDASSCWKFTAHRKDWLFQRSKSRESPRRACQVPLGTFLAEIILGGKLPTGTH